MGAQTAERCENSPICKTSNEITHVEKIIGTGVGVERFAPVMICPNQTSVENKWQGIWLTNWCNIHNP
jgi:hypothetical protein